MYGAATPGPPWPPVHPGQPVGGPEPPPDPPAAPGRRAGAWAIDFALTLVLAALLGGWAFNRVRSVVTDLPDVADRVGGVSVLRSGVDGAAADIGRALWRETVIDVQLSFALLVVLVFAYHFAATAWKGRTLGKVLLDLQVRPAPGTGRGRLALRAAVTAVTDIGLFALACSLLLTGRLGLSVACWILAVAAFWANALPIAGRTHRTLADHLARTTVVRTGLYQAVVNTAAQGTRLAAEGIRQGTRIATEGARTVAADERVQRALASPQAQQLQNTGRHAIQKARQLYEAARTPTHPASGQFPPGQAHPAPGHPHSVPGPPHLSPGAPHFPPGPPQQLPPSWSQLPPRPTHPAPGQPPPPPGLTHPVSGQPPLAPDHHPWPSQPPAAQHHPPTSPRNWPAAPHPQAPPDTAWPTQSAAVPQPPTLE